MNENVNEWQGHDLKDGKEIMAANFGALINIDHELLRLHLTAMVRGCRWVSVRITPD